MNRSLASVLALAAAVVALAGGWRNPARGPAFAFAAAEDPGPTPAAVRDSVAERLQELHSEVDRATQEEDPFEKGPPPDLVVLTSSDVHGETAPCG